MRHYEKPLSFVLTTFILVSLNNCSQMRSDNSSVTAEVWSIGLYTTTRWEYSITDVKSTTPVSRKTMSQSERLVFDQFISGSFFNVPHSDLKYLDARIVAEVEYENIARQTFVADNFHICNIAQGFCRKLSEDDRNYLTSLF